MMHVLISTESSFCPVKYKQNAGTHPPANALSRDLLTLDKDTWS